jgi:hypothetical protein
MNMLSGPFLMQGHHGGITDGPRPPSVLRHLYLVPTVWGRQGALGWRVDGS